LPFPDHRHRLKSRRRSSRRPEAAKAEASTGQTFYVPMILLGDVVEVFDLAPLRATPSSSVISATAFG
jgi:hypothetical protein